ncbi:alpha/beta hydrolase family protein [Chryseobacterium sp. G0201]|uniref:alpha/beta hydrolase family protein n=1 Tax=Chryseobacterium sp. G0201 TaxID=2487065 RepID=UPI0013DE4C5E|nr:prolyl oligopeptidase family serine peptidase [Chryseobacterium sp. G0201]
MGKIFLMGALLSFSQFFSQKTQFGSYDSISKNFKNYYTLGNLKVSDDGRYSSVKQIFKNNRDTMLITDRKKPGSPILKLIKKNQYFSFISNNRILALGGGEAELITLPNLKSVRFSEISKVAFLRKQGHYLMLGKDDILKVFDAKDKRISEMSHVKSIFTDENKFAFVIREKDGQNEVFQFLDGHEKLLFSTSSQIKRIDLSASQKHLMITELTGENSQLQITFINSEDQKISSFMVGSSSDVNVVKVFESRDGSSYLIDVQRKVVEEKTIPEVWYANDGNLKAKTEFAVRHEYFNWNTGEKTLQIIPSDRFPMFTATNNKRFLLAFDPYTNYRYETRFAVVDLYLYDLVDKTFTKILANSEDLMVSSKGNYLLSYNYNSKEWSGIDLHDRKSFHIPKHIKSRPIFDENENYAFFESRDGLYRYDLKLFKTELVGGTAGLESSISGYSSIELTNFNNIHSYYLNNHGNSLLQLRDNDNNSSWQVYDNNTFRKLLPLSSEKVSEIKWDDQKKYAFAIEENYNIPTKLIYRELSTSKSQKKVLNPGNQKDMEAKNIRQEIIDYRDSFGNPLKGTLYYPTHFNESEKYPLIVYIYMRQSTLSNDYDFPSTGPAGFDLRTLLNKGYFVYKPDIVFSNRGSGLSALDCVHSSIDALADIKGIDHQRLGLTGHSMGGYETNFIATHSKRFKTYIAGSAHSDVVRAYFSYHYDWGIPYTWQFENGQHFMNVAFSKNKEIYFKNNPIHYVENVSAPILIWTGKKDENVRWDHTMEFYIGLLRNNKQAIALFYPEGTHNLGKDTEEAKDLNRRSFDWWDYHLKDKKDIPWIDKQMKKDAD